MRSRVFSVDDLTADGQQGGSIEGKRVYNNTECKMKNLFQSGMGVDAKPWMEPGQRVPKMGLMQDQKSQMTFNRNRDVHLSRGSLNLFGDGARSSH